MKDLCYILLSSILIATACNHSSSDPVLDRLAGFSGKGPLITTRIASFEQLREMINIEYTTSGRPQVKLTQGDGDSRVVSVLRTGLNETDFIRAKKGNIFERIKLGIDSPYAVANRIDLLRAYILARRRFDVFGEGDIAFYDFAEQMVANISEADLRNTTAADLSEKGYLNTFNHCTAQCFMTSLFSEKMADFIADVHERDKLPELITGELTEAQINDLHEGAVDNYVDLINNEWGQELGKVLKSKYGIDHTTVWEEQLLTDYMNDIQTYFAWVFGIGFEPFRTEDEIICRFVFKLNSVFDDVSVY